MLSCASRLQDPSPCHGTRPRAAFAAKRQAKADPPATAPCQRHRAHRVDGVRDDAGKAQVAAALRRKAREGRVKGHGRFMHAAGYLNTCCEKLGVADAARRREPAVGQEAVSSRSRMSRPVRSQLLPQRHGSPSLSLRVGSCTARTTDKRRLWLNTACCLSAKGVAKTKQRFDRAVGPAVAPCAQMQPQPQRFFNELKSHPSTEGSPLL